MRVITGKARGRKLITLSGDDVRPTTDKVKESVFSIIQFEVEGRRFLDLFAGSGQMGIEALSRGAKSATFLDLRKDAISVVRKNLEALNLAEDADVRCTDSLGFLRSTSEKFDVVFVDPPYNKGLAQKALELLPSVMNPSGVIVIETADTEELSEVSGDFSLDRTYRYGKIKITTYRRSQTE
ncbi:MAG: 16S rRNA (guanine(966)-N(2))-methyltransferase RsmD [Ruminococcus sp.]|nr:16S rRNA (guanine(966)-N(2))-methyltransferase RsmD [Ruminococcus sp.]